MKNKQKSKSKSKLKIKSEPIKIVVRDHTVLDNYFPSAFEKPSRSWPDHTMS